MIRRSGDLAIWRRRDARGVVPVGFRSGARRLAGASVGLGLAAARAAPQMRRPPPQVCASRRDQFRVVYSGAAGRTRGSGQRRALDVPVRTEAGATRIGHRLGTPRNPRPASPFLAPPSVVCGSSRFAYAVLWPVCAWKKVAVTTTCASACSRRHTATYGIRAGQRALVIQSIFRVLFSKTFT